MISVSASISARLTVHRSYSSKGRSCHCEARRRHIHGPLRPMDYPNNSLISRLLAVFRR